MQMKNLSLYLLLAILVFSAFSTVNHHTSKPNQDSLPTFADELFQEALDEGAIAGAAVIVYKDGKMLLDKAYGYANLEWKVPLTKDASFEIGSVTKQFTAAAILRLVEKGKLSLEDDFTKYLDFDTRNREITINQLLNHTSGIPSYTELPEFWALSIHGEERDSLVRLVEKNDFLFEPGEAMIYNNSAYFFLGLIIEKVAGMTYEEYLAEQFFTPLGMDNTYYCSSSEVVEKKAYGYNFSPEGLRQKAYLDHTWPYAAGSLCSTTADLLTWMKALHTGKVFDKTSYQSMIMPDALNDGTVIHYAKGLMHYNDYGHECISHGGGIHGFLSDTKYYPKEDLYIICLVNTAGPKGGSYFGNQLTWDLLEKKQPETKPIDMDLKRVEGTYTGQGRGRMLNIEVKALDQALIIDNVGGNDPDTISTYFGEKTWVDDNSFLIFKKNALRINQLSGSYLLIKKD
jgi:CubicO group peptidase (beta-lactamase class C family)